VFHHKLWRGVDINSLSLGGGYCCKPFASVSKKEKGFAASQAVEGSA